MSVLCVKEHTEIPVSDRFSANPAAPTISGLHHIALDRFNRGLSARSGPRPFDLGYRSVRSSQYCGVVCLGKDSIEVLPKIEEAGQQESDSVARIRLLRMLSFARKLPIHEAEASRLAQQGHTLLDVILRLFCRSALDLVRRGLLHRYEIREGNLCLIKGKLKFADHVSQNSARRDRAYCTFDEFSPDNTANRMIKAAALCAAEASSSAALQATVRELLWCLDEISDVAVTLDAYRAIPKDRSTHEYRKVLELGAMILFGPYPELTSGRTVNTAFLFDMNRLFEEYVSRHLALLSEPLGVEVSLQGPRKWLGHPVGTPSGNGCFQLQPDILVTKGDSTVAILDTKWKVLDTDSPIDSIAESDVYQMLAYMTRYGCSRGTLIFPLGSGSGASRILSEIDIAGGRTLVVAGLQLDDLRLVTSDLTEITRQSMSTERGTSP